MRVKKLGVVLAAVCFSFTFATMSWAAGGSLKVGYFDIQKVLSQSKWGKQSNDEFKLQGESVKAEVEGKSKAYRTAKDEFEKKKDVLDQKSKEKKLKELADMQQEGEKLLMESNSKLQKLSNDLSAPLVEKILDIVKKIGRDEKYDFIFEQEKAGLVFATDKEDLTKKVINDLDKVTPMK